MSGTVLGTEQTVRNKTENFYPHREILVGEDSQLKKKICKVHNTLDGTQCPGEKEVRKG